VQFIVEGYPAYAYTGGRAFDPNGVAGVLIHGAAFDHSVWQWQSRHLAHQGFSVLAPDLPGHGRSPGDTRRDIKALARWVIALADAAGFERVHLAGHSMGSLVALEAALAFPQRLHSLALVGTAAPMAVGEPFLAAARDRSPAALDMEATWGHARHAQLATSAVPGVTLLGASRSLNGRSAPGVLDIDLSACRDYAPDAGKIAALRVRTLVVGGKRDQMTPMKAGQALAAAIPAARFVALDAGHSMMSEAPREVATLLREHWRGQ
jgi:pimeloyl-ACP methyl ester carboxylesterase